jgi:nitroimidazol reductase NimA-like FMN-containing flavoprotein (pyridoxamine 5'-phosphate oxidase superfamily)
MLRKDREMPAELALSIVDKCEYAALATVNEDGSPYCIPISIVRDGNSIYFHCAHEGQKSANMKNNSKVCVACVGNTRVPDNKFTTEYESAVVFGVAKEVDSEQDKTHALRLLCMRHTPGNMDAFDEAIAKSLSRTAVWRIEIEQVTGKRNMN